MLESYNSSVCLKKAPLQSEAIHIAEPRKETGLGTPGITEGR